MGCFYKALQENINGLRDHAPRLSRAHDVLVAVEALLVEQLKVAVQARGRLWVLALQDGEAVLAMQEVLERAILDLLGVELEAVVRAVLVDQRVVAVQWPVAARGRLLGVVDGIAHAAVDALHDTSRIRHDNR
eukprot:363203-Chlamydomonas_euryale.AAC.13